MITVHFHGSLSQYGTDFRLDARSPAEVIRALCLQIPGLEQTIKEGDWHVLRGPLEDQDSDVAESLTMEFGTTEEMHILPAVAGANGGVLGVIAGAVMIGVGIFTANPYLIAMGAGMLVGGMVMMTTVMPSAGASQEPVDQRASFLFGKPTNTSTQGVAIPRGYGRMRVGSVAVSTSLVAEELTEGNDTLPDSWDQDWPLTDGVFNA